MALDHLKTPQPHYIPGYTGYCPQYIYRFGETFGSLTHKILLDPTTHKSYQLVLSDGGVTDFQVPRKIEGDPERVELRNYSENSIYRQYITPGYTGSIPKSRSASGKTFGITAHDGMMELEKQKLLERHARKTRDMYFSYTQGDYEPSHDEKMLIESEYKLPLVEARPEYANILQDKTKTEQCDSSDKFESPYFKHYASREKVFKSDRLLVSYCEAGKIFLSANDRPGVGFSDRTSLMMYGNRYTGHVPFNNTKFGEGYGPLTNESLCDFTTYYHRRNSTEWAPVNILQPEPPMAISSNEIYHKHVGMVPNYTGHVPGRVFRSGKTFGADSRDAKRWLRGDYS